MRLWRAERAGFGYITGFELNLEVELKIAIGRMLADLNLAVRYGIAIRIILYASRKLWRILIWRL